MNIHYQVLYFRSARRLCNNDIHTEVQYWYGCSKDEIKTHRVGLLIGVRQSITHTAVIAANVKGYTKYDLN